MNEPGVPNTESQTRVKIESAFNSTMGNYKGVDSITAYSTENVLCIAQGKDASKINSAFAVYDVDHAKSLPQTTNAISEALSILTSSLSKHDARYLGGIIDQNGEAAFILTGRQQMFKLAMGKRGSTLIPEVISINPIDIQKVKPGETYLLCSRSVAENVGKGTLARMLLQGSIPGKAQEATDNILRESTLKDQFDSSAAVVFSVR